MPFFIIEGYGYSDIYFGNIISCQSKLFTALLYTLAKVIKKVMVL